MAEEKFNNLNSAKTATYTKGLIKDYNDSYVPEGVWTNAINAVTNSHLGDQFTIGNEPSNVFCVTIPYTVIGLIRRDTDTWVVFSTNDVLSEIGIFRESDCTYKKTVADKCLGFRRSNLITGHIQYNFDCTYTVFFADGLNPDRALNLDDVPYQISSFGGTAACPIPIYSDCLDCEKIRLNYLANPPCISIEKAVGAGSLLNGSYQAVVAYSINGQRVTNYFTPSNVVGIWDHIGVAGGLDITITDLDTRFEEYELVIVSTVNANTVARRIGTYNTTQSRIFIDNYTVSLPSVPLTLIPLVTPVYEKSDKMFQLNRYLLRSGIYSKFDFNYQPLANQIVTYWQEVEYPASYYYNGGVNTTYYRDEQYAFFIRWIYNDGDKSASYHIPGRPSQPADLVPLPNGNKDVLFNKNLTWQTYNTASVTTNGINQVLPDGGLLIREGLMGYWESTELYPSNNPTVWGNLCGLPIRHHKFPDNGLTHIHNQGGDKIYMLGVRFDNIVHPVDNQGNKIENIIGFEILRGSREGNRTIVAKGLFNNMREYNNLVGKPVLYQNYPYNDLRTDYFLSSTLFSSGESPNNTGSGLTKYKKDYFSFHSPDTNFNNPFLSYNEVRLYTKEFGTATSTFEHVYAHPKEKLLSNRAWQIALFAGIGIALNAAIGKRDAVSASSAGINAGKAAAIAGGVGQPVLSAAYAIQGGGVPLAIGGMGPGGSGIGAYMQFPYKSTGSGDLWTLDNLQITTNPAWASIAGETARWAVVYGAMLLSMPYWAAQGTDQAVKLILEFLPFKEYTVQINSHGFYSKYKPMTQTNSINQLRREKDVSSYIDGQLQAFDTTYNINNLFRNDFVAVKTKGLLNDVSQGDPTLVDDSRKRIRDTGAGFSNPYGYEFASTISAYYGGLKIDYDNQYGQLSGIVQVPISPCYIPTDYRMPNTIYTTPTLFGGDIYIGRYTEKNPFFYFNTWLINVPNGSQIDYSEYLNVIYPRYWANFTPPDTSYLNINFGNIFSSSALSVLKAGSSYYHMDRPTNIPNRFAVTDAYFYLFNNGVRDFFVETEINLAFRDYGDNYNQRFYDHKSFTDLTSMFRSDVITAGNYYKYDYSLSVSKLLSNYVSFGVMQSRNYDPLVAETCYTYYPTRALYSLQQQSEQLRDSWRIYLPNNYKDFENIINCIKPINRTGSIILFDDAEPTSVTGVDQLQTGAGTKITIGDGGLFAQPFQSLVNADDEYEYGSCQDTRSVVNTPYGTFWMSRRNGKIMQYTGNQIVDISMNGMRMWFALNLPNILTTQFPDFTLIENPVIGIGCQAVYDNQYEIVYFCKRDYKAKLSTGIKLDPVTQRFYLDRQVGTIYVELGDPDYFENCSWTISYDPKTKMWLSFHDWHPNNVLGTNDHFYTVLNNSFWKHNETCQSFCNYYGVDYPYEVEFPVNTGSTITSIKNIEYTLEVNTYSQDCLDAYQILDANFDYAMIYNTEQNSGILNLNPKPRNPVELLKYPIINPDSIDIIFSKEENKYRFNQFWDATKDRGEFSGLQTRMFDTEQNGYKKFLNPVFIDYAKSPLERKKFRHYGNRVILGRLISNNQKLNLKVVNTKETLSPR